MGRPKKITPEIRTAIIRLHNENYYLSRISRIIFISRNIRLSKTAIKYTIDDHNNIMKRIRNMRMVTDEEPIIHRIQMVIPGITPDSLIQSAKKHIGERAITGDMHNVKFVYIKSPPINGLPDVNTHKVRVEKK